MSAFSGAIDWAGKHPVTTALGVFAAGAVLLVIFRRPAGDSGMSAFYAAQAAQAASGNQLAAVQNQSAATVAVAKIAADRDVHLADTGAATAIAINTVNAQTNTTLAQLNADVLNQQELTRQQAQKQQFFLATGEQQIEGAIAPYIMHDPGAAAIFASFNQAGSTYHPAH